MSDEKKFFYANAVEVGVTPYDVSLKFMRSGSADAPLTATAVTKNVQLVKIDEFIIGMSPQHAKAMLPSLTSAVAQYEQMYGTIPQAK